MGLLAMALSAGECARTPGTISVWPERLGRYVCDGDPQFASALAERTSASDATHPTINPVFKLVFLTVAGGTAFFTLLCLGIALLMGKSVPSLPEEIVKVLLHLAGVVCFGRGHDTGPEPK